MRKDLSAAEIIRLCIESDEKSDIATVEGDYKINNKEGKKKKKIYDFLAQDIKLAEKVYAALLDYNNVTTKTDAAAQCLKLDIFVDEAIQVLKTISKRDDIGVRRLNAEMILRVYRGEVPGAKL